MGGGWPPPLMPMYATTLRECLASYSVSQRPAFLAFTASGLDKSGKYRQGGGPRTQMGRGQPLVYILGHAFKIGAVHLAPFNRDVMTISKSVNIALAVQIDDFKMIKTQ